MLRSHGSNWRIIEKVFGGGKDLKVKAEPDGSYMEIKGCEGQV